MYQLYRPLWMWSDCSYCLGARLKLNKKCMNATEPLFSELHQWKLLIWITKPWDHICFKMLIFAYNKQVICLQCLFWSFHTWKHMEGLFNTALGYFCELSYANDHTWSLVSIDRVCVCVSLTKLSCNDLLSSPTWRQPYRLEKLHWLKQKHF